MFIVLEIQKNNDVLSILPFAFSDYKKARAKYYSLLAIASETSLERHGAVLLTEGGSVIAKESFFNVEVEETEEAVEEAVVEETVEESEEGSEEESAGGEI